MAERLFERAFHHASLQANLEAEAQDEGARTQKAVRSQEDELRNLATGMTSADAIQRILLAAKDHDYFRLLELPPPEVDALGRPVWDVSGADVSKAYRRLSVLVHPDKNPGEDARRAFEALNEAHRALKDPGKLEGVLAEHLEAAVARRAAAESRATLDERVALMARQREEAGALRKAEGEGLRAEVLRQMREKQERARRQKEAAARSRKRAEDDDGDVGEKQERGAKEGAAPQQAAGSDDDDDAQRRREAIARRQKQRRKIGAF